MKVTVEPQEKAKEIKYPCLMIDSSNVVVLFYSECVGTVLQTCNNFYSIGFYKSDWQMSQFTPYNGKITLENDNLWAVKPGGNRQSVNKATD